MAPTTSRGSDVRAGRRSRLVARSGFELISITIEERSLRSSTPRSETGSTATPPSRPGEAVRTNRAPGPRSVFSFLCEVLQLDVADILDLRNQLLSGVSSLETRELYGSGFGLGRAAHPATESPHGPSP
jgi:hypothetical protein